MTQQAKRTAPRYDRYWQMAGKTIPSYTVRAFTWAVNITLGVVIISGFFVDGSVLVVQLLPIIFLIAIASMIGSELYCSLVVSRYVRSLVESRQWNSLRHHPSGPDHAFADIYVTCQLRCWKAWTAEILIRVVSAELVFFAAIQIFIQTGPNSIFAILCAALLMLVILIFEARWRFTLVVATSIAVATRISSFVLAALVAIIGLHALQLLIILLPLSIVLVVRLGGELLAFYSLLLALIGAAVATFRLYRAVRDWALAFAQRELFRSE